MPGISIPENLKSRMDKRKAPRQPYAGLIEELLNKEEKKKE